MKNNTPLISIIVPVYKVEKLLPRCIESIIVQTFEDWELILIDDGSPDNSGYICDNYASKDNRIKVIHKNNEGVSVARNIGIDYANTDLLTFIDSDDWIEPNYIETLLNASAYDIVYANIINDYEARPFDSKIEFKYENLNFSDQNFKNIFEYNILDNGYPFAKLYKASIIKNNNLKFNPAISFHEDHIFVLEYLMHCKTACICERVVYHYIHHLNSTSLSARRHPVDTYLYSGSRLISLMLDFVSKYSLERKRFIIKPLTSFGFSSLIQAVLFCSKSEMPRVVQELRNYRHFFYKYYRPSHFLIYLLLIPILERFPLIMVEPMKYLVKKIRHIQ